MWKGVLFKCTPSKKNRHGVLVMTWSNNVARIVWKMLSRGRAAGKETPAAPKELDPWSPAVRGRKPPEASERMVCTAGDAFALRAAINSHTYLSIF